MKIIIPHQESVKGGIEKFTYSMLPEMAKFVELIVIILPANKIAEFQKNIPDSQTLVYESFSWSPWNWQRYFYGIVRRVLTKMEKRQNTFLYKFLTKFQQKSKDSRIANLVKKHSATHCLYLWQKTQSIPSLKIPISAVIYDLHWNLFPEIFKQESRDIWNQILKNWLEKADLIFAISEKTRQEAIQLLPISEVKIKTVPLAAEFPVIKREVENSSLEVTDKESICSFYYPAAAGFNKNHITLFKAVTKLAAKNLKFKLILTGWGTEWLVDDNPAEFSTPEACRSYFQSNKDLLSVHIEALGYCSQEQVEDLYQSCSCVVLPSIYDGFGLPFSEAIVRGIPVISSNLDIFLEQIELYKCSDRVTLFSSQDVDALALCLEDFISHPRQRISPDKIQERFSHWTWNHVAKAYIDLLQGEQV